MEMYGICFKAVFITFLLHKITRTALNTRRLGEEKKRGMEKESKREFIIMCVRERDRWGG